MIYITHIEDGKRVVARGEGASSDSILNDFAPSMNREVVSVHLDGRDYQRLMNVSYNFPHYSGTECRYTGDLAQLALFILYQEWTKGLWKPAT